MQRLGDDAFAQAVKSGNHHKTMRLMRPYHGKLQIQEVNGNWCHPLQDALADNDKEASDGKLMSNFAPY